MRDPVIASGIIASVFAGGDPSEAIQCCVVLQKSWIASSHSVFEDENLGSSQ